MTSVGSLPGGATDSPQDRVDLRPLFDEWGLSPRTQGLRGTCSVFTVTGALEFAMAALQGQGRPLSVEFLNWAGHRAADRSVDGGFFSELWAGYEAYGVCPEAALPYRPTFDAALEPGAEALREARERRGVGLVLKWIKEWGPETGLTESERAEIKATLRRRLPICGGFRWPTKPVWREEVLQVPPPEEVFDGHSVLLVGYRDDARHAGGGVFLIRNSGRDGVEGGLPYAYVSAYMNDAAWIGPGPDGS